MSSSKLLEQAIVDAQALRDAAFKSAQETLLEKYAPQIKEAVQQLLEQEEEADAETPSPTDALAGGQSDMPLTDFGGSAETMMGKGKVAGTANELPYGATDGEKLCPCPDDDKEVEIELDLGALADQLSDEEEEQPGFEEGPSTGMMGSPQAAGGATSLTEDIEEVAGDKMMSLDEEELAEISLDEILGEELDEVHDERHDPEAELEDPKEEQDLVNKFERMSDENKELFLTNPGKYKIVPNSVKNAENPYIITLANPEPDPYFQKGRRHSYTDDGDLEEQHVSESELSPKQKKIAMAHDNPPPGPKGDNKIDAKDLAALRAGKKKEEPLPESKTKQLLTASAELLKEHKSLLKTVESKDIKIQKLLDENKKFLSTIEEMSSAFKKLEEVNLTNARLFYSNQVLKSASLNERQKNHIVDAISKADSVNEAKTVYETLINSVGGPAEKERSPKSLNEVISKKSSFRLPHKQAEQPVDPGKDRWLKLAGIK